MTPPLPELDTASFTTHLPFIHQPLPSGFYPPERRRETQLALKIVAAGVAHDATEESDERLSRLEAKLDLVLEISLRSHHPQPLPLSPCRIGLEALVWRSTLACRVGDTLLVSLNPAPGESLQLSLPGRVTSCHAIEGAFYDIIIDIREAFDKTTQALWEKWVFQCHRRAILER